MWRIKQIFKEKKQKVPKSIQEEKEEKLIKLAKKAWQKTLKEFYFPPLNEPKFLFDHSEKEGFYIDPDNRWQITMNLANTPVFIDEEDYIKYYHAIEMHEVSHYQIIPYDGLMNAKLLNAAMKSLSRNFASIAVNIFSDLIIDTKLHNKYPELMEWELKKTAANIKAKYKNNISPISKFLLHAYEKFWGIEIDSQDTSKQFDDPIDQIKGVIMKNFEDETTWPDKMRVVASLLKDLIENTFTLIGRGVKVRDGMTSKDDPSKGGQKVEMPKDLVELMDNPMENKNSDKLKQDNGDELRQKAEEYAKDVPYSEFGAPASQAGILIEGDTLATWYRGLAKDLIQIRIFEKNPSGQLPVYPEVWRIGDPIEELDIVQSLLASPLIIPNITTRKWTHREGPGHLEEKKIPDLLIVLDSSGSMGWNIDARTDQGKGNYHTALVSSFAALHYAAKKGANFSVINFSGSALTCPWTSDYRKAEKTLLKYQGSGTHLPTEKIFQQCKKAERNTLVFIITDFGIYNWGKSKKLLSQLANLGHKIVGFFIGARSIPQKKFKDLLEKVTFYPIRSQKDLINLVIKEVKRYYL
ncbi:MAG: vWA domain-containing protein [Promethearchaeia archaeon]